jgi:hypothetical protein
VIALAVLLAGATVAGIALASHGERGVSAAANVKAASATRAAGRPGYLKAAKAGVAAANAWWDKRRHWWHQQLGKSPLATNWGIVHFFGATDALAIADPTPAHLAAVRFFVQGAERYWNPDLRPVPGYGPYPGNHGATHRTWYDDEGWWGIAFYDAFRATGDHRALASADRALAFLDSGWDPKAGGIYWDSRRRSKSPESLAGGTLLAAYLYKETRSPRYLAIAKRYTAWADSRLATKEGLYNSQPTHGFPMPYVEGPMAVAFVVICQSTGDQSWCAKGENLAAAAVKRFPVLNMGPQYDSLYIRALLELYRLDGNRRWYDIAVAATERAMANGRAANGLYLRTWDGRPITSIGTDPNKLQTHAATTSAIAWLAAARPPG